MTRLLRHLGVLGWLRLFQAMRARRRAEPQRKFTLQVPCTWLGISQKIVPPSYLLVTEANFAKAVGFAKAVVQGVREN